jgi:hypothetical protein
VWQNAFVRRSIKLALAGLPLMLLAVATPIIAKAFHFGTPALEAAGGLSFG